MKLIPISGDPVLDIILISGVIICGFFAFFMIFFDVFAPDTMKNKDLTIRWAGCLAILGVIIYVFSPPIFMIIGRI